MTQNGDVMNDPQTQWLLDQGYTIKHRDLDEHLIIKGDVKIKLDGSWAEFVKLLEKPGMDEMLEQLHYATTLHPPIRFNIQYSNGWYLKCTKVEREWLRNDADRLLKRVIEFGIEPPSTDSQEAIGGIKYAGNVAALNYRLTTQIGTPGGNSYDVLTIKAWYEHYDHERNEPRASFTPDTILSVIGIPPSVASILDEPFSPSWWNAIRSYYLAKPADIKDYQEFDNGVQM